MNADDFGQSTGINRGIIRAYEQGIVTSASLMVRWPEAEEAAAYGHARPDFDLGLHFDFGEWAFLDDSWVPVYEVVPLDDAAAVAEEASRQLREFRRLVGRDPTHLDSHQHVHQWPAGHAVFLDLAARLGVPLRQSSEGVRYCGDFYGQTAEGGPLPEAITVEALIAILERLPTGFTEIGCHPAQVADLDTMYRTERLRELEALCDPRVGDAIRSLGIELCSFQRVG